MLEEPLELGTREVGAEGKAGLRAEPILATFFLSKLVTDAAGARVLPDDGMVVGLAGRLVSDESRLALVGDPYRR